MAYLSVCWLVVRTCNILNEKNIFVLHFPLEKKTPPMLFRVVNSASLGNNNYNDRVVCIFWISLCFKLTKNVLTIYTVFRFLTTYLSWREVPYRALLTVFVEPLNWSIVITSWGGVLRLCVLLVRALRIFGVYHRVKSYSGPKYRPSTFGVHILVDHEQHYWIVISAGKRCPHPNSWQEELRFFCFFFVCM